MYHFNLLIIIKNQLVCTNAHLNARDYWFVRLSSTFSSPVYVYVHTQDKLSLAGRHLWAVRGTQKSKRLLENKKAWSKNSCNFIYLGERWKWWINRRRFAWWLDRSTWKTWRCKTRQVSLIMRLPLVLFVACLLFFASSVDHALNCR